MTSPNDPSSPSPGVPPPGPPQGQPQGVSNESPQPSPGWGQPTAQPMPPQPLPASPGSQVAVPPPKSNRRRNVIIGIVVVVALLGGAGLITSFQQQQNYDAGHAAYLAADCSAAIPPLTKAATGDPGSEDSDVAVKATAELQECEALVAADDVAASGDTGDAIQAYRAFVTKYPDSPLADTAKTSAQSLLAESTEEAATVAICDDLAALEDEGYISSLDETLPPLLYACGQAYEAGSDLTAALANYLRFRNEYPDHELADAVETAYARAAVAEAEQSGAGELPAPVDTGSEGGTAGQATIVIQNDSPDGLAMVFSGPDVRVEDIEPCPSCQEYAPPGPDECPALGPIAEYVVAPGSYDVVVKSGTGANVTPFRGTWDLEAGQVYESCFYIITGP
jgi:hypothetical protein